MKTNKLTYKECTLIIQKVEFFTGLKYKQTDNPTLF